MPLLPPPFLRVATPPNYKNHWARLDAWRYHPYWHPTRVAMNAAPGFGIALVIFGGYLAYERMNPDQGHH
ncbi:hypothetical protein DFJ74DRAFT_685128 [Hyaloraphidium curvatum]|nr:hypothetical protein DFJ74DRAFT_685128 [Hyaloraphidium curvatum]